MTAHSAAKTPSARPPITLRQTDADRLSALALQLEARAPKVAELLLAEIDRARIQPDDRTPADVVQMNSTVEFIDGAHGASRTVQLVYPADADIEAGRISVGTPVGVGLIGLRAGQSILWPDREGHARTLQIVSVSAPPPA